jgi:protein-L-isoaspartate(D-aspartate) O-methyltransferase
VGALIVVLVLLAVIVACAASGGNGKTPPPRPDDREAERRRAMVGTQIEPRGIRDAAVLGAMRAVPRHRFVPAGEQEYAYSDGPLAIGLGQTISQPYIVALMTELIRPDRSMKVLEVGTGSGYQAAVLAECVGEVYTIEILADLGRGAEALLASLGYRNVHVRIGDGYDGWPEAAPFDAVVVTAAPEEIPQPLLDQLAVGGRLVAPVGSGSQDLIRVTRTADGWRRETIAAVRFVPMTGKALQKPR